MQLMKLYFRFRLFPETFETDAFSLTGASSIVEKANSFFFFNSERESVFESSSDKSHMKLRVLKWLVGIQKGVAIYKPSWFK